MCAKLQGQRTRYHSLAASSPLTEQGGCLHAKCPAMSELRAVQPICQRAASPPLPLPMTFRACPRLSSSPEGTPPHQPRVKRRRSRNPGSPKLLTVKSRRDGPREKKRWTGTLDMFVSSTHPVVDQGPSIRTRTPTRSQSVPGRQHAPHFTSKGAPFPESVLGSRHRPLNESRQISTQSGSPYQSRREGGVTVSVSFMSGPNRERPIVSSNPSDSYLSSEAIGS